MAKSIGIDLGTTNSVSAIKKIKTEILINSEGDSITPSCVIMKKTSGIWKKKEFIVGRDALEWMKQDPENTIMAVKRLMGRSFHDKEIQNIINNKQLRYQIQPHRKGTENSLAVIIGTQQFTPEEISSKILEKIRRDAETSLAQKVDYAVITVPAYFDDKQKHATRYAAALAGIKVQRLLPEPTAAAISYGVDNINDDEAITVLVFDLGGGTFDLSVLTISGGQFIEQGKGGDMWLGGEDIDFLISDYVLAVVAEESRIIDIASFIDKQDEEIKFRFLAELKSKAEKAKIQLSSESEVFVEILGILKDSDGDPVDVDVEITREKFDEIIAPIVESTMKLVRNLLADMNFTLELIDKVLLVGGSSQIPLIAEAIENEFGPEKVLRHKNPILAIAEGAAILSHRLAESYECPQCSQSVSQQDIRCRKCDFDLEKHLISSSILEIVHSSAHDYYIVLENDEKHLLVEKGTPLPITLTENFSLIHESQKLVHLRFLNIVNDEETSIGDLWLGIELDEQQLEARESEKTPLSIVITLNIDENNLIEVSASIKEFPDIQLSKTISRGKADEKLFLSLEKVIDQVNSKTCPYYVAYDLLEKSPAIIKDIRGVIDPETGAVNEKEFENVSRFIEKSGKMVENEESSKSLEAYTEIVLENYSPMIPGEIQKVLRRQLQHLVAMDEKGSYEDVKKAIDDLNESLDDIGLINDLMQLDKAIIEVYDKDQITLSRFMNSRTDILAAIMGGEIEKAASLLDEIMPEVMGIVDKFETTTTKIHKGIAR